MKGNLPLVRVDDIQIQPRDNTLVLATHGRSIWILDDLTPLEKITEGTLGEDVHLFDIGPATHFRLYNRKADTGHKWFMAPNPPYGAVINYYLKDKPTNDVKITISDRGGKTIRELTGAKESGMGRVVWDLRTAGPEPTPTPGAPGGGGFFGPMAGPRVAPGEYNVKIAIGTKQATGNVRVEEDPRIQISESDRVKLADAMSRLFDLLKAAGTTRRSLANLKTQLTTLQNSLKDNPETPKNVTEAIQKLSDDVTNLQKRLFPPPDLSGGAGPPLPDEPRPLYFDILNVAFNMDGYTAAPTADEMLRLDDYAKKLRELIAEVNKMMDQDVPKLNKQMSDAGLQIVNPGKKIPPP